MAGTIVGLFWAAPLGIGFGIVYAVLAHTAVLGAETRSHEAEDALLGKLAVAVLLAGVARAVWVADLASIVPIFVGAAGAVAAFGRVILRRRWVEEVTRGRVRGSVF